MGELKFYRDEGGYRLVEWAPNRKRLKRLRRQVQGPLELYSMYNYKDKTQKFVYPDEKYVIKRFRKWNGEVVDIYDTDSTRYLDGDWDSYKLQEDMKKMDNVIRDKRIPKEKRINELLKDIYGDPTYPQHWRREHDPVYD